MSLLHSRANEALKRRCDAFFGSPRVWAEIEAAYSQPHRAHHNLQHLRELFESLDPHLDTAPHAKAIELAVWFHDFVYVTDPQAYQHNEMYSAGAMAEVLSRTAPHWLEDALSQQVALASEFILATKKHSDSAEELQRDASKLEACRLFLDADLSILAAAPGRLQNYDMAIAAEWGQDTTSPSAVFCRGRRDALDSFLKRPKLFLCPQFSGLEAAARKNLQALVEHWQAKAAV